MNTLIQKLYAFAAQRPGLDFANYGDVSAYRSDSRRVTQQLADSRRLLGYCRDNNIVPDLSAFSGRLSLVGDTLEYCAGQYFPTEYRAAVAACCAAGIWSSWRETVPDNVENKGEWLRRRAVREFGHGLGRRWFN